MLAGRGKVDLQAYLNSSCVQSMCVQLREYGAVHRDLEGYVQTPGVRVWVGTEYTNYALYQVISAQVGGRFYLDPRPCCIAVSFQLFFASFDLVKFRRCPGTLSPAYYRIQREMCYCNYFLFKVE